MEPCPAHSLSLHAYLDLLRLPEKRWIVTDARTLDTALWTLWILDTGDTVDTVDTALGTTSDKDRGVASCDDAMQ